MTPFSNVLFFLIFRVLLYQAVEDLLFKFGYEGKACLLRAICEMHESPLIGYGFFGEVLELFLTWVYTTISHCIIFPLINQRNLYWVWGLPISNLIVIFQFVFWRENCNFWNSILAWKLLFFNLYFGAKIIFNSHFDALNCNSVF